MRYLIPALLFVFSVGCKPSQPPSTRPAPTEIAREWSVRGFDFTRYADRGFLFSPGEYSGDFEAVGMLRVTFWPEMERESAKNVSGGFQYGPWKVEEVRPSVVVDSLYRKARDIGADAVVRFKASRVTEVVDDAQRAGVRVSGFAINRK